MHNHTLNRSNLNLACITHFWNY